MSAYLQIMCLLALRDDGHVKKIQKLGLRIRMALKRNSPQKAILDELIDIHRHVESMNDALGMLQVYERDLKQQEMQGELNAARLSSMVAQIRFAYAVALHDVQFTSKQYNQRKEKDNKHIRSNVITVDNEPLRVKQFIHDSGVSNVHVNEIAVEQHRTLLLDNNFEPTQSTAASAELQVWKTKQNHYHHIRNKLYLPSNSRYLSLYIYQQLFKEVWINIHHPKSYTEKRVYAIILLSMLSGRSIHAVSEEIAKEKSKRTWLAYDAKNEEGQSTGHYTRLSRKLSD